MGRGKPEEADTAENVTCETKNTQVRLLSVRFISERKKIIIAVESQITGQQTQTRNIHNGKTRKHGTEKQATGEHNQ